MLFLRHFSRCGSNRSWGQKGIPMPVLSFGAIVQRSFASVARRMKTKRAREEHQKWVHRMQRQRVLEKPWGKQGKLCTQPSLLYASAKRRVHDSLPAQQRRPVFADPTTDFTFKKLFANEHNIQLLINLLNSLLNFKGEDEIVEARLNPECLFREEVEHVKSTVDVHCVTKSGQKIAVEMQGKHEHYFLARTQVYMAKLVAGQVKSGESVLYHKKLHHTYILCIGRENIFSLDSRDVSYAKGDESDTYEKTVVPTIVELGVEVPDNKMHWKFYELQKFDTYRKNNPTTTHISSKHQWLNFLIDCKNYSHVPQGVNDIIQAAYDEMRISTWDGMTQALYWKAMDKKANAENEQRDYIEQEKRKSREDGEAMGQLRGEAIGLKKGRERGVAIGLKKGRERGLAIGQLRGEVGLIIHNFNLSQQYKFPFNGSDLKLTFITSDMLTQILIYLQTNRDASVEEVLAQMNLIDAVFMDHGVRGRRTLERLEES